MSTAFAIDSRVFIGVSGVISVPTAVLSDSNIEMRAQSPPKSYSVPSFQVTTCEPATATAAFWIISWVRSATVL